VHRHGDAPAAARLAKKALALYPEHCGALALLGAVYCQARQFADGAYYFGLLCKQDRNPLSRPAALYSFGVANFRLGRNEEARKPLLEFMDVTAHDPTWEPKRADVTRYLKSMSEASPPVAAPVRNVEVADPKHEARVEAPTKVELPGVSVDFLPIERPACAHTTQLVDHFLRLRLLEPRLAQNFEDLLCLGSLN
jgi:hypothetical protein